MTSTLLWLTGGLAAYLLGSVPFGFLIAKTQGKDIRTLGSGNIGATNVFRSVSKPLGILTFALDLSKGSAASGSSPFWRPRSPMRPAKGWPFPSSAAPWP